MPCSKTLRGLITRPDFELFAGVRTPFTLLTLLLKRTIFFLLTRAFLAFIGALSGIGIPLEAWFCAFSFCFYTCYFALSSTSISSRFDSFAACYKAFSAFWATLVCFFKVVVAFFASILALFATSLASFSAAIACALHTTSALKSIGLL